MHKKYRINSPHIVHDTIEGETILINLKNGNYYNIEEKGSVLWEIIGNGGDINQLAQILIQTFDLAVEKTKKDLEVFISVLLMENLIVPLIETDIAECLSAEGMKQIIAEKMKVYGCPVINKYSDMRDALMLDPIHEVDERGWPTMNEDLFYRDHGDDEISSLNEIK